MKVFGIIFLVFAIIYVITIVFVKRLIDGINEDCTNEQLNLMKQIEELRNQLREQRYVIEDNEYDTENTIKEIQNKIKQLKGKQLYGNVNLVYNAIEEILNKKELSHSDQTVR